MENPIEMDDLGVPLFSETSIFCGHWEVKLYLCFLVKNSRMLRGVFAQI